MEYFTYIRGMKKYRIKKQTYSNNNSIYFIEVSYLGIPIWFKIEEPLWGGTTDLCFNDLESARNYIEMKSKKIKVINIEII